MKATISIPSSSQPVTLRKHGCNVIVSTWGNNHIQITYNHRDVEVEWIKVNGVVAIKMYSGLLTWMQGKGIIHIYVPRNVDIYYV